MTIIHLAARTSGHTVCGQWDPDASTTPDLGAVTCPRCGDIIWPAQALVTPELRAALLHLLTYDPDFRDAVVTIVLDDLCINTDDEPDYHRLERR